MFRNDVLVVFWNSIDLSSDELRNLLMMKPQGGKDHDWVVVTTLTCEMDLLDWVGQP